MSDATDFEAATLQISTAAAAAAAAGAAAVAAIPIVGEVIIALTALLYALGVFGNTDEIENAVQELKTHFDAILNAQNQVLQMRDVANQLAKAKAQLDVVRELGPGQSLTDAQRSLLDTNTDEAVKALGDISYWQRPFFYEGVYYDAWSGFLTPDPSLGPGSLVFDYRLTMPAYLEAIAIRLIAILALDGQFKPTRLSEIAGIATQLEAYHDNIAQAIVNVPTPTDFELRRGPGRLGLQQLSIWDLGDHSDPIPVQQPLSRPYGAVEKFTKYSAVDSWPESRYPANLLDPSDHLNTEQGFYNRLALGTLSRWKKVYSDIGLHSVWTIVTRLKVIAQVPTASFDASSDWSLAEIDDLIIANSGAPHPKYSARDLVSLVGDSSPIGFRDAFTRW